MTDYNIRACLFAVCCVLLLGVAAPAGAAEVRFVRLWPAEEYTRVTLESDQAIDYSTFSMDAPERLVVDLRGVRVNDALRSLGAKVAADDPYIRSLRVGQFKANTVRLVLDLKGKVKPSVFTLKPNGEYRHRLVLDLYPEEPLDPLMALIEVPAPALSTDPGAPPAADAGGDLKLDDALKPGGGAVARNGAGDGPSPDAARPDASPGAGKSGPGKSGVDKPGAAGRGDRDAPRAAPAGESVVAQASPTVKRLVTIAIDAGHGGEDPGARGRGGAREKDVTLAIAKKLKELVDGQANMRAVLIRDGDYFIPLHHRTLKARKVSADLFVSIHADAFIHPRARGSSVFALSERGATSTAARWLAKRENEADLIGGVNLDVKDPYLARTLLDLSQTATINDSLKLGKEVLAALGGINQLHKPHVEQAGFAVLKSPDIPSILVETAFITNPDEERRLRDQGYQRKMAASILAGIKRYFEKNPPLAKSRLVQAD